jgi:hypothetical protein
MSRSHRVANHRHIVAEYRRHGTNMSSNSLEMLRSVQRVLARYRPPERSEPAAVAWRQGQAYWRRYYFEEILRFLSIRRIVDAVRASPTLAARHLIRRMERALPQGMIFTLKRLAGRRLPPPLGRVRFGDFCKPRALSVFRLSAELLGRYLWGVSSRRIQRHSGLRWRSARASTRRKFEPDVADVLMSRRTIQNDDHQRSSVRCPTRRSFDCLVVTRLFSICDVQRPPLRYHAEAAASLLSPRGFPGRRGEGCNLVLP